VSAENQLPDWLQVLFEALVSTIELKGMAYDEVEWLKAASQNPAFNFLNDPEEAIYSLADGEPFRDKL
jgi:hypothetical protein